VWGSTRSSGAEVAADGAAAQLEQGQRGRGILGRDARRTRQGDRCAGDDVQRPRGLVLGPQPPALLGRRQAGHEALDPRQRAELDAAVLIGLEGERDLEVDRDVLEAQGDRPPAARLAGLAEQLQDVTLRGGGEVQRLGVADAVDRAQHAVGLVDEVEGLLGRGDADRAAHRDGDRGGLLRDAQLDDGLGVVAQDHGLALRRGRAAAFGDGELDPRVVDEGDRRGPAGEGQLRPQQQARGHPGDHRLALEVQAGAELIALGRVLEGLELRDLAVDQQHARAGRRGREGDRDRAVLARGVLAAAEPHAGARERRAGFIEHAHGRSGGADPHAVAQAALAEQGPARLAVADQLDHVGARTRAAGELDAPTLAADRRRFAPHDLLVAGDHAVEVDRGVDLGAPRQEVRDRVDAEGLDDQLRDVLEVDLEHHRRVRRDARGVAGRQLEVDALAQRGQLRRAEHGGPALGVRGPHQQPRGRQLFGEPVVAQQLREGLALVLGQEVLEVLADQLVVDGHRREAGGLRRVDAGGHELLGGHALQPLRPRVMDLPREREEAQQAVAVVVTEAKIELELVVQDLGLERIEARSKAVDEPPQRGQVRAAGREVGLPVDVGRRPQPRQRRGDPHGAVAQLGPQPGELVELGARQQGVHREAAEGARGLLGEVGGDQGDEPGDVGAGQSLQEVAPTGGVELAAGEVGERPVGDLREVGAAPERVAEQRGLGEQGGVEAGRMVPGGGDRLGLIVEPDPGLEAQLVGVGVKVGAGPQQQLTPREPAMRLVAAAVTALPAVQDRVDLVEAPAVLQRDASPVVVLHGAGREPGQRGVTVVSEGEGFELLEIHEVDEPIPPVQRSPAPLRAHCCACMVCIPTSGRERPDEPRRAGCRGWAAAAQLGASARGRPIAIDRGP
jgi:hypothetical protein